MRRAYVLFLVALVCASLLQGCLVVRTPQIELASSLIQSIFDDPSFENDTVGKEWSARVGEEGRLVEVVEQGGFFVFVSSTGDAIAFDGWNIRSIIGFGGSGTRQILVDYDQRRFRSARGLSSRRCEGWKLDPYVSPASSKRWVQQCDDQVRVNSIVVDNAGAISEISQVIDVNGTRAVLKRLKN